MQIHTTSFPSFSDLSDWDVGAWLWSRQSQHDTSTHNSRTISDRFDEHHVWIEHRNEKWFVGVEENGECLIAGIWEDDPNNKSLGKLINLAGKYSQAIKDSELTDDESKERIWSFLEGQSITMTLRTKIGKNELDSIVKKSNSVLTSDEGIITTKIRFPLIENLLSIWTDHN